MGYWAAWGERQNLLHVLYENLKDPSKVLVNKDLADVKHSADGVTVTCADGSTFSGDLLVGTDGVFSKTRSKMWELAESDHPDLVKHDKNCMYLILPF
jgi:2-polyprenyl-6-methoxyphenol hydroxylase-like FAD-dependent oxidoreductase